MKRIFLILALVLGSVSLAQAQAPTKLCIPNSDNEGCITVGNSPNVPLPVTGSFSATTTGFEPGAIGTPISVTTGGDTGSLPAGDVVVAFNVGTTNIAYCNLGASVTTAAIPIAPNGGWFAFTVGAATQITCITASSTTTVNLAGGSGLATGTGGGGGGGVGGAVTIADGADVTLGAIADAATTAGGTGTLSAKLRLITSQLSTISTNTSGAIPAGTNPIGKVSPSFGAAQLSHQVASFNSSGNNTVITRVTGTIKVYGLLLSCASSVATMIMQDGTSTSLGANQGVTSIFLPIQSEPYYVTTTTNNFVINLSSGISCTGWVKYLDN